MSALLAVLLAAGWAQDASQPSPPLPAPGASSGRPAAGPGLPALGAAPWMSPMAGVGQSTETAKIELETGWSWTRLASDLELIGRVRRGLAKEAAAAKSRLAQIRKDPRTGEPMPEDHDAALASWRRIADRLLILDSVLGRYHRFAEVRDPGARAGAFLAAYCAFAAETRYGRAWLAVVGDPSLTRHLNEAAPDLGLPLGAYGAFRRVMLEPERDAALVRARAYAAGTGGRMGDFRLEGSGALARAGRAAAFALSWIQQDARGPRGGPRRRRPGPPPVLEGWMSPSTGAGAWTAERPVAPVQVSAGAEGNLVARAAATGSRSWLEFAVSTETVGFEEEESVLGLIIRVLVLPPSGPRPAALIDDTQLEIFERGLEPGDILLARREAAIEEPGLGGWWTAAGLYVGTAEQRDRLSGSRAFDERLNEEFPDAYWASLQLDEGRARGVISAAPGGVRLVSLGRWGKADALAGLRIRGLSSVRWEAVRRAFGAVGLPYDEEYDPGGASAMYSAKLILRVFDAAYLGLEARGPQEAGPASPNDIARAFDARFATREATLDLIDFLDGREAERRAVRGGLEGFRLTWKRPRWRFEEERPPR